MMRNNLDSMVDYHSHQKKRCHQ